MDQDTKDTIDAILLAPAAPVAKCVLTHIYGLTHDALQRLRKLVETLLLFVDTKIMQLRAILIQYDPILMFRERLWKYVEEYIGDFKNSVIGKIPDEFSDTCPELFSYFVEPLIGVTESLSAYGFPMADKYMEMVSIVSYYDKLITYWMGVKVTLLAILDVMDDAAYVITERDYFDPHSY